MNALELLNILEQLKNKGIDRSSIILNFEYKNNQYDVKYRYIHDIEIDDKELILITW